MKFVKSIATLIVVAAAGLLLVSATAEAYDFANICPAQAPPKWGISDQAWTQFVNSCITNDAAATAGRAFDRPSWDKCIERCGLADDAEGRTPPKPKEPANQLTTSGTPTYPNWCSDVPASPPPPNFELSPGAWAATRKMCMNATTPDLGCSYICGNAIERWHLWKLQQSGQLKPNSFPSPTDKPQGPFPVPGGGSGFILPMQPAPSVPAPSASPESSILPPGQFSSFPGQDLNATAIGQGQPPNVSADVSPSQNAEFINYLGLWVWNKPTLPVPSPPPAPTKETSLNDFWCVGNGVNGQPLNGCVGNQETFGTFGDTQIGYDATLQRWIATTNASDGASHIGVLYFAVSATSDATGAWNKWWVSTCNSSPYTAMDEPLLGWSGPDTNGNSVVVVDVVCFQGPPNTATFGPDNVFLVPSSTITSVSQTLPTPVTAPCVKMAPARDEQGSLANAYLLASIVPNSGFQATAPNCFPSSSNTAAYAVEYTASVSGVFGSNATGSCAAGTSGCSPVSTSFGWGATPPTYNLGLADQSGCGGSNSCTVTLGDARITAAQIRPTTISSTSYPALTFGFGTGVNSGSSGPQSQNVWFLQNLTTASWLAGYNFAGGSQWYAFPTIATDGDLEVYLGSTQFTSTSFPSTIWDVFAGLSFVGQNFIEIGTAEYTGNPGKTPPVRWGDYNTMIFDPQSKPPGGGGSWWSVEEISRGGSDQSTNWEALADPSPLPYFVGSSWTESECSTTPGNCAVTINVPAGVQNGDVVLVDLLFCEPANSLPTLPDSSWSLLSASNISGSPMKISATESGATCSSWFAAHIFGSVGNDSGSYKFKHYDNGVAEFPALMVVYRGAGQTLSSYTGYGFQQNGHSTSFTTGSVTPNGESRLVAIAFPDEGCDLPENTEANGVNFGVPSGVPALTTETPLISTNFGFLVADAGVPRSGQTYGPYTFTATDPGTSCNAGGGLWLAWGVAIPEQ